MGASSAKVFENTAAMAWAQQLESTTEPDIIVTTLQRAVDWGDTAVPEELCHHSLAAAEVLASLHGRPCADLPEPIRRWAGEREFEIEQEVLDFAKQAVIQVQMNSELKDIWESREDGTGWHVVLNDLQRRLTF